MVLYILHYFTPATVNYTHYSLFPHLNIFQFFKVQLLQPRFGWLSWVQCTELGTCGGESTSGVQYQSTLFNSFLSLFI